MDKHLRSSNNDPGSSDYQLYFDYAFLSGNNAKNENTCLFYDEELLDDNNDTENSEDIENAENTESIQIDENKLLMDTTWLWHLSESREHKLLIRHPIIKGKNGIFKKCSKSYLIFYISICLGKVGKYEIIL